MFRTAGTTVNMYRVIRNSIVIAGMITVASQGTIIMGTTATAMIATMVMIVKAVASSGKYVI